jgi:hypothetical protein
VSASCPAPARSRFLGAELHLSQLSHSRGPAHAAANPVKGAVIRGFVLGFSLFVDGEAVGELGTVVCQDGVDLKWETGEEAGRGWGPAIGENFEIDEAGGAIDRDIGVAALAVERRQVFEIDIPAGASGLEGDDPRLLRGEAGGKAVVDIIPKAR